MEPISRIPLMKIQDINSFSPSLVFVAINFGAKKVPIKKAINEGKNPSNDENFIIKKRKVRKKIKKPIN